MQRFEMALVSVLLVVVSVVACVFSASEGENIDMNHTSGIPVNINAENETVPSDLNFSPKQIQTPRASDDVSRNSQPGSLLQSVSRSTQTFPGSQQASGISSISFKAEDTFWKSEPATVPNSSLDADHSFPATPCDETQSAFKRNHRLRRSKTQSSIVDYSSSSSGTAAHSLCSGRAMRINAKLAERDRENDSRNIAAGPSLNTVRRRRRIRKNIGRMRIHFSSSDFLADLLGGRFGPYPTYSPSKSPTKSPVVHMPSASNYSRFLVPTLHRSKPTTAKPSIRSPNINTTLNSTFPVDDAINAQASNKILIFLKNYGIIIGSVILFIFLVILVVFFIIYNAQKRTKNAINDCSDDTGICSVQHIRGFGNMRSFSSQLRANSRNSSSFFTANSSADFIFLSKFPLFSPRVSSATDIHSTLSIVIPSSISISNSSVFYPTLPTISEEPSLMLSKQQTQMKSQRFTKHNSVLLSTYQRNLNGNCISNDVFIPQPPSISELPKICLEAHAHVSFSVSDA